MKILSEVCKELLSRYCGIDKYLKSGLILGTDNLEKFINAIKKGKKTQIFMGRGPSKAPHIAHIITWKLGQKIQKLTNSKVIFQISDDEKYYLMPGQSIDQALKSGTIYPQILSNLEFCSKNTYVFSNIENMQFLYSYAAKKLAKHIKLGTICSLFGYNSTTSIGSIFYGLVEICICTSAKYADMLVITGPDQLPFFKSYLMLSTDKV